MGHFLSVAKKESQQKTKQKKQKHHHQQRQQHRQTPPAVYTITRKRTVDVHVIQAFVEPVAHPPRRNESQHERQPVLVVARRLQQNHS